GAVGVLADDDSRSTRCRDVVPIHLGVQERRSWIHVHLNSIPMARGRPATSGVRHVVVGDLEIVGMGVEAMAHVVVNIVSKSLGVRCIDVDSLALVRQRSVAVLGFTVDGPRIRPVQQKTLVLSATSYESDE